MGMHGPLTSLGLGRSPYDDVVEGNGEADPRAPFQLYDERGRPTNPETRLMNRDIIRSHNEVMLAIGVAEPESGVSSAEAESARKLQEYKEYEEQMGWILRWNYKVLQAGCDWLVTGLRQRIMVYESYSAVPFYDLFRHHSTQQTWRSYLLAGLPSSLLTLAVKALNSRSWIRNETLYDWVRGISSYFILHLDIFMFLQRTGIISSALWLPSWRFFVPGSALSPVFVPPLPGAFTGRGSLRWLGALALGAAPVVGLFVSKVVWSVTTGQISKLVYPYIPRPTPQKRIRGTSIQSPGNHPDPTSTSATGSEQQPQQQQPHQQPATNQGEGPQSTEEPAALGTARRQSIFSARGDEFDSEDEDLGNVGATFISFDVEASEATANGPQGGVWSAELRPNVADNQQSRWPRSPTYRVDALTRLPAQLATELLGTSAATLVVQPAQALVYRAIARGWMLRAGLPTAHLLLPPGQLPWGCWANLVGLNLVKILLQADIWASLTMMAKALMVSDETWTEAQGGEAAGES